ncbi:hypothetical protein R1flu_009211 [Riccia fluitans]|uniref:Uncharacterized protein n=1 Tax=Riccia fluitans TaxID=41844 RepID=A0ABD1Z1F2_9MARC
MTVRYHAPRPWLDNFSLVDTSEIERYFQGASEDSRKQLDEDVQRTEQKDGAVEDSRIPIVELERNVDSGASLDRVRDSLLFAGFGVGMKTGKKDVKEEQATEDLPDYYSLWS